MAKIIDHFTAVAQGGATFYRYAQADNTSQAIRIYRGDTVHLPADYIEKQENGMYRITYPNDKGCRWMFIYNIGSIEPVWKTVTDPCTPPESLTLENKRLTVTGGAGGDLNALDGFGLSWRSRAIGDALWGEWSADERHEERTISVDAPPGEVRQFRVRTLGAAGEKYHSAYTVCETLLSGNSASGTPVVMLPVPEAVARCHTPVIRISCPPDPDGDAITLMRSIDGGEWVQAAVLTGSGGVVNDRLPALAQGRHTVAYHAVDANGAKSETDCAAFTVAPAYWLREIAPGTVIASRAVSHRADLEELLEAVNALRAFYGLEPAAWPVPPGRFADWQGQMQFLMDQTAQCFARMEQPAPQWPEVPAYPAAAVINAIREAVEA